MTDWNDIARRAAPQPMPIEPARSGFRLSMPLALLIVVVLAAMAVGAS